MKARTLQLTAGLVLSFSIVANALAAENPTLPPDVQAALTRMAQSLRPGLVPEAARVSLSFPDGTNFFVGDAIRPIFTLSNSSRPSSTPMFDRSFAYWPSDWLISALDDQGTAAPAIPGAGSYRNGNGMIGPLQPGQSRQLTVTVQDYIRLDRAGTYVLRVANPFGWTEDPAHPLPFAEVRISIALPTPAEAERRVQAVTKESDLVHFSIPLYLPALEAAAKAGKIPAVIAINRIATKAATETLMRLLAADDPNIREFAAVNLAKRLPLRPGAPPSKLWVNSPEVEGEAVYAALWIPEAKAPLLALVRDIVNNAKDQGYADIGRLIVDRLGGATPAPDPN